MKKIVLATKNRGKAAEMRKMLGGLGVEILTLEDFPAVTMPPETGRTFSENAIAKARHAARATRLPAIADDSGLEVDSLGGRPGVFSARYAGEGASDSENCLKLLKELEGVALDKRGARFRCVIALVFPDGREAAFDGALDGRIALGPAGARGFGYDPVFFIPERKKTAAELTAEEKNAISHRGKALEKLKIWFSENF